MEDDDIIAQKQYIHTAYKSTNECNLVEENHTIHDTLHTIKTFLDEYKLSNPATKRRSTEYHLLKSLNDKYPEVIFKATDKNIGLAALTLDNYNNMVMEHLSNVTNYKLVASDCFQRTSLINELMKKYDALTNPLYESSYPFYLHEIKFLKKQANFTLPKFHCLPKLHKQGPLKGRPIAGAVNWITTPISRILDLRLQDLLHNEEFSCVLKNSQQLVSDLELANSFLPNDLEHFYFITGDVQSLYPNIDTNLLQQLVTQLDFSLERLVEFICANSYVEYAGRIYQQLNGIAMGTNAAVSLANIYMALVVDRYLKPISNVFYYKRYIDDLFIIWKGTLEDWSWVQQGLNQLNPTIKIDFSSPSKYTMDFLDVTTFFNPITSTIGTQIYQKALNKYLYITPESCHVPHMFSGFVKGELTRYARLCSNVYSYEHIKQQFYQRLVDRGYSRRFLNRIFQTHSWSTRLREPHNRKQWSPILPFVIRYSKRKNIKRVENFFKRMEDSFDDYFSNPKLMLVYSRSKNINDLITSSALTRRQIQLLES